MNNNEQNAHDPLVEQVLVSFDLAAEHHVSHCEPCQAEREKLEDALRQFGEANREYAMRPESFWEQQAARIRSARRESQRGRRIMAAVVPTLAALLLLGVLLIHKAPPAIPEAQVIPAVQTDSDHELLLAVERAMESDTPQALAPLTLLGDESDSNLPLENTSRKKEMQSHAN